jgi:hypothetical protein
MTATGRRPRERKQVVLDGLTGESVPFAAKEQNLRDVGVEIRRMGARQRARRGVGAREWLETMRMRSAASRIPDPPFPDRHAADL